MLPIVARRTVLTIVACLAGVGGVTLCVLFTPLSNYLARPLMVPPGESTADVIVVLGGGTARNGTLSDISLRRVWYGVRRYTEGSAPSLLFSTGITAGSTSEARAMALAALTMGVPASAIQIEERSTRTFENAIEISRLFGSAQTKKILLVTHPTHMARAVATFRKVGLTVQPAPTDGNEVGAESAVSRALLFGKVLYEYLAWAFYWYRGWV